MATGLFRVALPDGSVALARGDPNAGPRDVLAADLTLDAVLARGAPSLGDIMRSASTAGAVPSGASILAPVQSQEVWAAGVTYRRSRDARAEEASDRGPYDLVYEADRPELFFKAPGWRVRGPGDAIAIRADSTWDVPEPELAVVLTAALDVAGYTIGNDMSSRTIEGQNTLYLPQAKIYDGAASLGPCIVPADDVHQPFDISMTVVRDGSIAYAGETSTSEMRRGFRELARYLGRALSFPVGVVLMTGTGIVPDAAFTLEDGDVVRIDVSGLGVLENTVETVGTMTVPG